MKKHLNTNAEVIAWLQYLEEKYPVTTWRIGALSIWPLIKIRLYLRLFKLVHGDGKGNSSQLVFDEPSKSNPSNPIVVSIKLLTSFFYWLRFYFMPIKRARHLFFGAYAHRVVWNGELYNRFVDPLLDNMRDPLSDGLLFEYHGPPSIDSRLSIHESSRVFALYRVGLFVNFLGRIKYALTKPPLRLEKYDLFLSEISNINFFRLHQDVSIAYLQRKYCSDFYYMKFYSTLIRKTKCEAVYSLCYYTSSMPALMWAASRMKITAYDIQHGGQDMEHLAYTQFNKLPESSKYELMPDVFWCWDKGSADVINLWAQNSGGGINRHKALVLGNPWVDYILNNDFPQYNLPDSYVLYSLQPYSELLEPEIIKMIISSGDKYRWYLRLHPRQLDQKQNLISLCYLHGILDFVEIEEATSFPLPILLKKCKLHITRSSGSAIEAALMGKPSLIMDELGKTMFYNLIEEEKAVFFDSRFDDIDAVLSSLPKQIL